MALNILKLSATSEELQTTVSVSQNAVSQKLI